MINLTQERLKEVLEFNPKTGEFLRLVTSGRCDRWKANSIAGNLNRKLGYVQIRVDGVLYYAHRLAWLWMTGARPICQIDHIDMDRANNRWANLREATQAENMANVASRAVLKWAHFDNQTKKWRPQIMINGKMFRGKRVDSPQEAHEICAILAKQYCGEFARVG